eukprot:m.379629 g.379629  ORF g.379629 m.379629 type:complete len:759 (-) comp56217_c0_seq14:171-2447(-)
MDGLVAATGGGILALLDPRTLAARHVRTLKHAAFSAKLCTRSAHWQLTAVLGFSNANCLLFDDQLQPVAHITCADTLEAVTFVHSLPLLILADCRGNIFTYNFATDQTWTYPAIHKLAIVDIAVSPTEAFIVCASVDETVNVLRFPQLEVASCFTEHRHPLVSVIVLPNDDTIVSTDRRGLLVFHSRSRLTVLHRLHHETPGQAFLVIHPSGRYFANRNRTTVDLWDCNSLQRVFRIHCRELVHSIAFTGMADVIAVGLGSNGISSYDTIKGNKVATNQRTIINAFGLSLGSCTSHDPAWNRKWTMPRARPVMVSLSPPQGSGFAHDMLPVKRTASDSNSVADHEPDREPDHDLAPSAKRAKKHSHEPPPAEQHPAAQSLSTSLSTQSSTSRRQTAPKAEPVARQSPPREASRAEEAADGSEEELADDTEAGSVADPRLIKDVSTKVNRITADLHHARDKLKAATAQFEGELSGMATEHAKELQKLISRHASQIAAFRKSQEAALKELEQQVQAHQQRIQALNSKRQLWEDHMTSTDISGYSIEDVQALCERQNVDFSAEVLFAHKADGKRVSKVSSASAMMKLLGCSRFGDATYMVHTFAQLKSHKQLVPPRLSHVSDPTTSQVTTWGIEETCNWLVQEDLKKMKKVFKRHHIAGDVLLQLDLNAFYEVEFDILDVLDQLTASLQKLKSTSPNILALPTMNSALHFSALATQSSASTSMVDSSPRNKHIKPPQSPPASLYQPWLVAPLSASQIKKEK